VKRPALGKENSRHAGESGTQNFSSVQGDFLVEQIVGKGLAGTSRALQEEQAIALTSAPVVLVARDDFVVNSLLVVVGLGVLLCNVKC